MKSPKCKARHIKLMKKRHAMLIKKRHDRWARVVTHRQKFYSTMLKGCGLRMKCRRYYSKQLAILKHYMWQRRIMKNKLEQRLMQNRGEHHVIKGYTKTYLRHRFIHYMHRCNAHKLPYKCRYWVRKHFSVIFPKLRRVILKHKKWHALHGNMKHYKKPKYFKHKRHMKKRRV